MSPPESHLAWKAESPWKPGILILSILTANRLLGSHSETQQTLHRPVVLSTEDMCGRKGGFVHRKTSPLPLLAGRRRSPQQAGRIQGPFVKGLVSPGLREKRGPLSAAGAPRPPKAVFYLQKQRVLAHEGKYSAAHSLPACVSSSPAWSRF